MKPRQLLLILLAALLPSVTWADVWQDPETKVNYEYTVGKKEASVYRGSYGSAGSPDATGDIAILSKFTVNDNEYKVTSIGTNAFFYCTGLTSVTIPAGVTSIGRSSFYTCTGLTYITIPEGVTSIGDLAFYNCTNLTNLTIPEGVTSIGGGSFSHCSNLTSINIPISVTNIGDNAFEHCNSLRSFQIHDISAWCKIKFGGGTSNPLFYTKKFVLNGTEITDLNIPKDVISIGNNAFYGCSGLTSVTIPNSVTSIGSGAFSGCSGLTSVTIPNSVTSIGNSAFSGCSGLTSVTIPNSVTSIGEYNQEIMGKTNVEIIPVSA